MSIAFGLDFSVPNTVACKGIYIEGSNWGLIKRRTGEKNEYANKYLFIEILINKCLSGKNKSLFVPLLRTVLLAIKHE